jgi:succinoglycan biosynthesis protein ExoU
VAEVYVVDDASCDDTAAAALACDDGTGRLTIRTLSDNAGPSTARNIAIAETTAPFIAILDADDFFLPGRFAALLAVADWDMVADNIVFVGEDAVDGIDVAAVAVRLIVPRSLSPAAFVEGSISRSDRYKGELGFLKPVLSRAFLDRHGLRYAAEMRLSEDYDLYVRALIGGARFRIAAGCYYVAVERSGSLSVAHGVAELAAVDVAMTQMRAMAPAADLALHGALRRHHLQIRRKLRHRAVLARKREVGVLRALWQELGSLGHLAGLVSDVCADKIRAIQPRPERADERELRFLL